MTRFIQFILLVFAFVLLAGPVMKHYGYEPADVLQQIQQKLETLADEFSGKAPAIAQVPEPEIKTEYQSIDPRELDKLFMDSNPRYAVQESASSTDPIDYNTRDEKEFKEMIRNHGVFKEREGNVYNVIVGYKLKV